MIVAFTTFHHAAIILHDSDQTKTEQQQPRRSSTSQAQTSPEQTRYASTRDQTTPAKTRQHQTRDETRSDKSRPDRTTVDQTRREDTRRSERRPIEVKTSQKKTREDQSREHQRISDKTTHDMTAQKTKRNCSHSELFSLKHSSWWATSMLCCRNVPSDATWWKCPRRKGFGLTLPTFSSATRFREPEQRESIVTLEMRARKEWRTCGAYGSKKHVHRNLLTKLLKKLQVAETMHVPSAGMEPTQGGGRSL